MANCLNCDFFKIECDSEPGDYEKPCGYFIPLGDLKEEPDDFWDGPGYEEEENG